VSVNHSCLFAPTKETNEPAAPHFVIASLRPSAMSLADSPAIIPSMAQPAEDASYGSSTPRAAKRTLFGLGTNKESSDLPASLSKDASRQTASRQTASPTQFDQNQSYGLPSSPGRAFSTSPRMASPAGSQIFERDVQDGTVLASTSTAIPTHIQTENYIPPVLDDASEAITNQKLDPDSVEIVTHTSHQPAAVTVAAGTYLANPYDHTAGDWSEDLDSMADQGPLSADNASNYGSLDSTDVRRLSFISFADVVQAEHSGSLGVAGSRDSFHLAGLTSLNSANLNRSPSPIRSPVSSQGAPGTSPPTSNPGSMKGFEMSPSRKPLGSPGSGQLAPGAAGDLNIETMTQALRRTGSGDLGQVRSMPQSPI
jgi:hypothetical protein